MPDAGTNGLPEVTNTALLQGSNVVLTATNTGDLSLVSDSNMVVSAKVEEVVNTNSFQAQLANARYAVKMQQLDVAEKAYIGLMKGSVPEITQKTVMMELAEVVRDENDLPRAQTIYAQYLEHWPGDVHAPEVLLRQGQIFRQMGLTDLALGKFYSVMTAALSLKNDQLPYYQQLVLQAQIEIADTHYLMGQFADAADFYGRLMESTDPALNKMETEFRLVRSLAMIGRSEEAASRAQDFISRYPNASEVPEVRYYLAQAFKALGRNNEALQQVLQCLQEEKSQTQNNPALWAYWQQRVGNEIGNQLYHEGDYVKALEVYVVLAQLDPSPTWQIPVDYQMGMTYEQLMQPQKAIETYDAILARETEVGTNATPSMQTLFEMARWRENFIKWQNKAAAVDQSLASRANTNSITQ
jgi:tetratricopeptide (TPR) repeat protein